MLNTKWILIVLITMVLAGSAIVGVATAMNPLDPGDALFDPDGDGLTNVDEFDAGSDPNNADTDNDGLPDGWEWEYNLDPTDPDDAVDDEDYAGGEEYADFTQVPPPNYTNYDEYFRQSGTYEDGSPRYIHTNPQNPNTDGDEYLDPDDPYPLNTRNDGVGGGGGGNQGGDAGWGDCEDGEGGDGDGDGNSDDDGDGLSDMAEMMMGTDPNNPDTDGDGLPDDKEIEFATDPNDWDTDNDLLMDGNEIGIDKESTDGHFVDSDYDGFYTGSINVFKPALINKMIGSGDPVVDDLLQNDYTHTLKHPYFRDSDEDGLPDFKEIDIGTDPYDWDTDNDLMADGLELGINRGSTDPFLVDSDNDGLDDPWEDNDLDHILNLEEQDFLGTSPNDEDSDGDELLDNVECQLLGPGPINDNSVEEFGYTQVTGITPDREDPGLDLSNPNSGVNLQTEQAFAWWASYFELSHQYYLQGLGGLPEDSTSVAWWHINPMCIAVWWNAYVDLGMPEAKISAVQVATGWAGDPAFAFMNKGTPYRWNNYDTHPAADDGDQDPLGNPPLGADGMEDNWDPRPTIPDERLDTFVALNYIQDPDSGTIYKPQFWTDDASGQTVINNPAAYFSYTRYGFPWRFSEMPMQKGKQYFMSIWVGLESTAPGSQPITEEWYTPLNITIGFHNASIGEDLTYMTVDDDFDGDGVQFQYDQSMAGWMWTPEDAELPTITLSANDLQASKVAGDLGLDPYDTASDGGPACQYSGHDGNAIVFINNTFSTAQFWSTITFYQIDFYFYIPDAVYAGLVVIDVSAEGEGNIHYQGTHGSDTGPSDLHLHYF